MLTLQNICHCYLLESLALRAATNSDGTINVKVLNFGLKLAGVTSQPIPVDSLGNLKASTVNKFIDLADQAIRQDSLELNTTTIIDTFIPIFLKALDI